MVPAFSPAPFKTQLSSMEEPGEQCTVVFALIVIEPANECVGRRGEGRLLHPPFHSLAGSVTIYAKTTLDCFPGSSMVASKKII